jgi:acyl-CoA hydrolase
MTRTITLSQAPDLLAHHAKGGRLFIPGGPIEPLALARAFGESESTHQDVTFCGMMIPGINVTDWAALGSGFKAEVFLPSLDLAATIGTGETRVLPLHYSAAYRYLQTAPFKAAVCHVCAPNQEGLCNLSLSADSSAALLARDVFKLGIINHALPRISGSPSVHLTDFDAVLEIDEPPIKISPIQPSGDISAIATTIANLVTDGATLQAGIGKLPSAVMAALRGHKNLKIHSGLLGDWALELDDAGALSQQVAALTAGVILGSHRLQDALRDDPRVALVPICLTHGQSQLAKIDAFTSINAALEIDLFGQINCEYAGSRAISGIGGALDFLRGARASRGGKPIIMLQALGKGDTSRIVPRLTTPTVSITRADAPIVVTEYGAVDLEPLDVQGRAHAIISLAAPHHREGLERAWRETKL